MKDACLVFGVGEGLGLAIAQRFAREGFHVFGFRRNADRMKEVIEKINVRRTSYQHFRLPQSSRVKQ